MPNNLVAAATVVAAIATVAVAIANVILVWVTNKYVRATESYVNLTRDSLEELRHQREESRTQHQASLREMTAAREQTETHHVESGLPIVVVRWGNSEIAQGWGLVIHNAGPGTALNVVVKISNRQPIGDGHPEYNFPLGALEPGGRFGTYVRRTHASDRLDIEATYLDVFGRSCKVKHTMETDEHRFLLTVDGTDLVQQGVEPQG